MSRPHTSTGAAIGYNFESYLTVKDKQDETRNHQVIEPSPVSLPVEVLQMVLFQRHHTGDLEALVKTGSAYHQAYLGRREKLLTTVICRELSDHDADPSDYLAAIWS